MLKRVNIQYTIDLEDLPQEVDRIYANAKIIFKNLTLPEVSGKDILSSDVLKKLDNARRQLTQLDHALNDVNGIVGSYVEYELSTISANPTPTQGAEQNVEDVIEMSE